MSWSKLKTIIILILLILNLFLFSLVAFLQVQSARYEASALSQALEVLTQSGISIDASALPESMDLPTLSVARDTVREQEVAEQLGGSRSDQLVSFLNYGRFYATLDPARPVPEGSSRTQQTQELLQSLGIEVWQVTEEADGSVSAVQSLNGVPVFTPDTVLTAAYDESGQMVSLSGRLLLGATTEVPENREPVSMPTVLLSFLSAMSDWADVYQSIESIQAAYLVSFVPTLTDPIRLTPVWHIVTDTGAYCLDAYTAEVTRMTNLKGRPTAR